MEWQMQTSTADPFSLFNPRCHKEVGPSIRGWIGSGFFMPEESGGSGICCLKGWREQKSHYIYRVMGCTLSAIILKATDCEQCIGISFRNSYFSWHGHQEENYFFLCQKVSMKNAINLEFNVVNEWNNLNWNWNR